MPTASSGITGGDGGPRASAIPGSAGAPAGAASQESDRGRARGLKVDAGKGVGAALTGGGPCETA